MKSIKGSILKILLISIVISSPVIIISICYREKRNSTAIKQLVLPEQGGPPLVETRAVEFSAQMAIKDAGKILRGKIFFQNGKIRQEFLDQWGQTITIVRPDKKIIWVVLPQMKSYMELPLKEHYPGQFIQMPPDVLENRLVGTETMSGYMVYKYEVTVKRGENGIQRQTFWMARQLGVPLKVVVKDRNFSIEYYHIKEGWMAEGLFDPPSGFKKTTHLISFFKKGRSSNP